jgi:S1-C subfamily serine protease
MDADLTLDLINATVQIEQPESKDERTVGTGFLLADPGPDGRARTVLVTAAHVFELMPGDEARIGWRVESASGVWRYAPQTVRIRDHGRPLWTQHPDQDVAVMVIKAPDAFARAAIPLTWLADRKTFLDYDIGPGDEMMTLGYPHGLSSNTAGFPILRSGRVASYPLNPISAYPTFLIDLHVLPGNSGGPVFMAEYGERKPDSEQEVTPFISGVLSKQVDLEIGVVTHAVFIRETIDMLDHPNAKARTPSEEHPTP